jgi:CRP-like cAMP-binding protein
MSLKGIFPIDKWDFKSDSVITDLPPNELAILTANMTTQVYNKGEIIFREGAYATGIFFIRDGKAKKYKADKEGKEQIIYVANTGEIMGYHALLAEELYPDSAAALEESQIAFIPKEDFLEVLEKSKVLPQRLLKTLSHEFFVMREKYKENFTQGMAVEINMSREDLASLVGTTRENILRILKDFKEEGILETKGRKIIIIDVNKLLAVANY